MMLTLCRFLSIAAFAAVFETVAATDATDRRSSEVALQHAASSAHRKAASGLRGLRALTQSHRSETASAFRAAKAQHSSARLRFQRSRQESAQVPLYVPKIGLANVTSPTAVPPPPPELQPWEDMQPIDTAVGHALISGFIDKPTLTPPPSQQSLDPAFGCPVMLTWPSEVAVSAPDPCGSLSDGNWTDASGSSLLINWNTKCVDTSKTSSFENKINPRSVTEYTVGNGDMFGTSQERRRFDGVSVIELRDCGGALHFTIEEKIYKQSGKADDIVCKKFNSCDGVIYFQYFVNDKSGKLVAMTPYTTLFQESFDITNPGGAKIATVSRNGWDPPLMENCNNAVRRVWNIRYASSPPGIWAATSNQWPIAEMMTMISRRDMYREPTGAVEISFCEAAKTAGGALATLLLGCCCFCTPFLIFLLCSGPCHGLFHDAEQRLFPKRMGKPMKYGN